MSLNKCRHSSDKLHYYRLKTLLNKELKIWAAVVTVLFGLEQSCALKNQSIQNKLAGHAKP